MFTHHQWGPDSSDIHSFTGNTFCLKITILNYFQISQVTLSEHIAPYWWTRLTWSSGNGLLPVQYQVITWSNADLLSIGPSGTKLVKFQSIYKKFNRKNLKMTSVKSTCPPFCPGDNGLIVDTKINQIDAFRPWPPLVGRLPDILFPNGSCVRTLVSGVENITRVWDNTC